jgi:hypothetical protein
VILEEDIEKALDYLRSSAPLAAQARANVKHLAEFLKAKKAQLAVGFKSAGSAAAAEQQALADAAYEQLLDGYKVAVEQDAFHTFKREAAVALIDAWRTQQSTLRAEGRIG